MSFLSKSTSPAGEVFFGQPPSSMTIDMFSVPLCFGSSLFSSPSV
jgi:hypothetical protein